MVFTSSAKEYANAVLDFVDPSRTLVHHRLFREHCTPHSDCFYIKDLRILDRDLKDVIIVDNAPYAFARQLDNGYPIKPFFDDGRDRELAVLSDYLALVAGAEDVRRANREKFKLEWLCGIDVERFLKYYVRKEEVSLETMERNLKESLNLYFKSTKFV